jgi:hypothetical protein
MWVRALTLLCGVVLAAAWSSPAQACTCPLDILDIRWPEHGAVGVELDAPLVVQGFRVNQIQATLTAADGTQVAVIERNRLTPDDPECVSSNYIFLTPSTPLAPDTEYVFHAQDANPRPEFVLGEFLPPPQASVSFVTGNAVRSAAMPKLGISVYGLEMAKQRSLELAVVADWPEPLFVRVQGARHVQTRSWNALLTFPLSCGPNGCDILHLPLGPVECAEPQILDVAGRTVFHEALCQPNKCAVSDGSLGFDTCGGEGFVSLGWDEWQEVPDGCGEPPDGASGCQLATLPTSGSSVPAIVYLLACLLRRRSASRAG